MKEECPWAELMEAIGIRDRSSIPEAEEKAAYSDYLILDSIPDNNPGIGAAGVTHDWNIDREIILKVKIPIIEAGGLGPENVKDAIDFLHPWGVVPARRRAGLKTERSSAKIWKRCARSARRQSNDKTDSMHWRSQC